MENLLDWLIDIEKRLGMQENVRETLEEIKKQLIIVKVCVNLFGCLWVICLCLIFYMLICPCSCIANPWGRWAAQSNRWDLSWHGAAVGSNGGRCPLSGGDFQSGEEWKTSQDSLRSSCGSVRETPSKAYHCFWWAQEIQVLAFNIILSMLPHLMLMITTVWTSLQNWSDEFQVLDGKITPYFGGQGTKCG